MRESDLEQIMKLWLKTTVSAHYFISQEYWLDNYDLVKNEYFPRADTYIYEEHGDISGFVSVDGDMVGYIGVSENSRRKGIGTELINKIKQKYDIIKLNVYADNEEAMGFYKKNGFTVISRQINNDLLEYTMEWTKGT